MRVCDFRLSSGTVPFPCFLSLFPSPGPDHFIRQNPGITRPIRSLVTDKPEISSDAVSAPVPRGGSTLDRLFFCPSPFLFRHVHERRNP